MSHTGERIYSGREFSLEKLATYLEEEQEKRKALEERVRRLEGDKCACPASYNQRLRQMTPEPTPTDDWELNLKRFGPIPDELKNFIKEEKARSKEEGRREAWKECEERHRPPGGGWLHDIG